MIISDKIFNRMKELHIQNGVFLLVSNNKEHLREEAPAFAHSLLGYSEKDVPLNEKIFMTDGDYISAETANAFIEFESKRVVSVPAKILIMHDVELLKDNVSDKLLKCIEDYNNDSFIILTTSSLENVSRTIKSRCMVFKEYTNTEQYFETFKNKYLAFMDKLMEDDYTKLPEIIKEMENLGSLNVVQAMFVNLMDEQLLAIASKALDAILTGSKDTQVNTYLVNSVWCLNHKYRSWQYVSSDSGE